MRCCVPLLYICCTYVVCVCVCVLCVHSSIWTLGFSVLDLCFFGVFLKGWSSPFSWQLICQIKAEMFDILPTFVVNIWQFCNDMHTFFQCLVIFVWHISVPDIFHAEKYLVTFPTCGSDVNINNVTNNEPDSNPQCRLFRVAARWQMQDDRNVTFW